MNHLLLILLILGLAIVIYLAVTQLNLRKRNKGLESELQSQITKSTSLENENRRLAKYTGIADADEKAAQLLQAAQETLDKAKAEAATIYTEANQSAQATLEKTKQEASVITSEARGQAKTLKDEAKAKLDQATIGAGKIVQDANKRAEEIAGSAYQAMKNASLYEQTVKAMKNIIEGYGDHYIIPGHSLLDDLAEDFGHTKAGEELKNSRERSKSMIRNGTAATCEYVEQNRRETAINFVLDAFNGKVDSSLSRVRHDNAGTLEQEIRDSFAVVNHNGKAFRDARITEEYLSARLEELKWGAVAQQLKLEEREEQRRIKEQIREEEKARKEYERAMRDAAKEEDLLRKAMEKAQQQVEQATSEQKAKYEQQLQELSQRLKEAEERNQRAMSMAQQTKRGHVYIISNIGSFGENIYKIGLTRRLEPLDRVRELGDSSVPFEFDVHALIFSDDAPALENRLHKHFLLMQMNKLNYRKEFFKVDLQHIREEVEKMELKVKWTMTAVAREYRETLAIEKAIMENPAMREAWTNRQLEMKPANIPEVEVAGVSAESEPSL